MQCFAKQIRNIKRYFNWRLPEDFMLGVAPQGGELKCSENNAAVLRSGC